jgi:hypothetical protein
MKNSFLVLITLIGFQQINAQFTRRDSLQGGLRFERTCFDVLRYDLDIMIDPEKRLIFGLIYILYIFYTTIGS